VLLALIFNFSTYIPF